MALIDLKFEDAAEEEVTTTAPEPLKIALEFEGEAHLSKPLPAGVTGEMRADPYSNMEKMAARLNQRWKGARAGLGAMAADQDPTDEGFIGGLIQETADRKDDFISMPNIPLAIVNQVSSLVTRGIVDLGDMVTRGDLRVDLREANEIVGAEARRTLGSRDMQYEGNVGVKFGWDVVENAVNMGGALVVGWATRNPGLTLGVIAGEVGGTTYADYLDKTGSHDRAMLAAKFHVAAEVIPETIPVLAMLRKSKAGAGLKRFFTATIGEGGQELITSILTQTYDATALENMSLKEAILNIDWGDAGYEGLIGIFVGGLLSSPGTASDYIKYKAEAGGGPLPSAPDFEVRSTEENATVIEDALAAAPTPDMRPGEPQPEVEVEAGSIVGETALTEVEQAAQDSQEQLEAAQAEDAVKTPEDVANDKWVADQLRAQFPDATDEEIQSAIGAQKPATKEDLGWTAPEEQEAKPEPDTAVTPEPTGKAPDEDYDTRATFTEIAGTQDIPTVDIVAEAIEIVGDAEFERQVKAAITARFGSEPPRAGQTEAERNSSEIEGVAREIVAVSRRKKPPAPDLGWVPQGDEDKGVPIPLLKPTTGQWKEAVTTMRGENPGWPSIPAQSNAREAEKAGLTPEQWMEQTRENPPDTDIYKIGYEPPTEPEVDGRRVRIKDDYGVEGYAGAIGTVTSSGQVEGRNITQIKFDDESLDTGGRGFIDSEFEDETAAADEPQAALDEKATEPVEDTGWATATANEYQTKRPEFEGLILSFKPGDDRNGKETTHYYGELDGTTDFDDMPKDVILNKDYNADDETPIFIVNQIDWETENFRQHKIMAGFADIIAAERGYVDQFDADGFGEINEISKAEFEEWKKGDGTVPYDPDAAMSPEEYEAQTGEAPEVSDELDAEDQRAQDRADRNEEQRIRQVETTRINKLPDETVDDLITFLAKKGGINVDKEGDVRQLALGELETKIVGVPGIEQHGDEGMTLDEAAEQATESGYIARGAQGYDSSALMDALVKSQQGPVYSMQNTQQYEDEAARHEEKAEQEYRQQLEDDADDMAAYIIEQSGGPKYSDPEIPELIALAADEDYPAVQDVTFDNSLSDDEVKTRLQAIIDGELKSTEATEGETSEGTQEVPESAPVVPEEAPETTAETEDATADDRGSRIRGIPVSPRMDEAIAIVGREKYTKRLKKRGNRQRAQKGSQHLQNVAEALAVQIISESWVGATEANKNGVFEIENNPDVITLSYQGLKNSRTKTDVTVLQVAENLWAYGHSIMGKNAGSGSGMSYYGVEETQVEAQLTALRTAQHFWSGAAAEGGGGVKSKASMAEAKRALKWVNEQIAEIYVPATQQEIQDAKAVKAEQTNAMLEDLRAEGTADRSDRLRAVADRYDAIGKRLAEAEKPDSFYGMNADRIRKQADLSSPEAGENLDDIERIIDKQELQLEIKLGGKRKPAKYTPVTLDQMMETYSEISELPDGIEDVTARLIKEINANRKKIATLGYSMEGEDQPNNSDTEPNQLASEISVWMAQLIRISRAHVPIVKGYKRANKGKLQYEIHSLRKSLGMSYENIAYTNVVDTKDKKDLKQAAKKDDLLAEDTDQRAEEAGTKTQTYMVDKGDRALQENLSEADILAQGGVIVPEDGEAEITAEPPRPLDLVEHIPEGEYEIGDKYIWDGFWVKVTGIERPEGKRPTVLLEYIEGPLKGEAATAPGHMKELQKDAFPPFDIETTGGTVRIVADWGHGYDPTDRTVGMLSVELRGPNLNAPLIETDTGVFKPPRGRYRSAIVPVRGTPEQLADPAFAKESAIRIASSVLGDHFGKPTRILGRPPDTMAEVLERSRDIPAGQRSLTKVKIVVEAGDEKISHMAKWWVDAYDKRLKTVATLRTCV